MSAKLELSLYDEREKSKRLEVKNQHLEKKIVMMQKNMETLTKMYKEVHSPKKKSLASSYEEKLKDKKNKILE